MAIQDADQYGAFLQTTQVWDVAQIQELDVKSPEFKELLVRMYQQINNIVLVLNIKDTGQYQLSEFVNGQVFFSNPALSSGTAQYPQDRQVIRKVINFGALPNTATKSVAHGITCTSTTTFTRIYGCASDVTGKNYIPLPYASPTLANNIELNLDATNVNITTGSNRINFTITYVVVEFIQT
ncbi:MAG TPA: hypothetical protein VL443_06355 [Cyclobacteriaceae bacterium]|jgi:hypothetical protein|nr:hypothetical protein [Cyclobacteriaceae bacterium]